MRFNKSSKAAESCQEQQKRVNAHFLATLPYWSAIYRCETLYARIYQQRQAAALSLVDLAGLPVGSRILDVGCGPGLTAVAMSRKGYLVDAIDTVGGMLAETEEAASKAGVKHLVRTSIGDIHQLAFPAHSFDLVIVIGVTEWLQSLDELLNEISRVLNPGGWLVISVDNAWALHRLLDPFLNPLLGPFKRKLGLLLRRVRLRNRALSVREYSTRGLDHKMRAYGLLKQQGLTVGFGPFSFLTYKVLPNSVGIRLDRYLHGLADARFLLLRSMGLTYVALARKSNSA